jgi:hypothetical protein
MVFVICSVIECVYIVTRNLEDIERAGLRFGTIVAATGIVGYEWAVKWEDWYSLLIYAREYIWVALLLIMICIHGFLMIKPYPEFRCIRSYSTGLLVWVALHAIIAPLHRHGFSSQDCQAAYMFGTTGICLWWIMFCCGSYPGVIPAKPYSRA